MLERHDNQDVAIFWDYENCHGPSSVSGYDVVGSIRSVAHKFGSVKLFKAYLELSEQAMSPRLLNLRSELQSSGVSLTDCPHNGRKNVADQMIIVDMLTYAIDRPAPATIILISGDRDFAYAASVLRLRRYSVVVISLTNPGAHPSLKAQANICLDWNADIMGKVEEEYFRSVQRLEPMVTEDIGRPTVNKPRNNIVSTAIETLLAPSVHKRENKPSGPIRHKKDNSINQRNIHIAEKATQTHVSSLDTPCSCQATLTPELLKEDSEVSSTRSLPEYKLEDVPIRPSRPVPYFLTPSTLEDPSSAEGDPPPCPFSPPHTVNNAEEVFPPTPTDNFSVSDIPQPRDGAASKGAKEQTVSLDEFPLPVTMSQRIEAFKKLVVLLRQQGQYRALRFAIACDLVSAGVIPQAGARDFQDYLHLAECFGLIEQGGSNAEAWISLRPQWQDSDDYENVSSQSLAQSSTNANEPVKHEGVVVDDTPMFTPQSTPLSLASWCDMSGCTNLPLPETTGDEVPHDVPPGPEADSPDTPPNAATITNPTFQLSAQASSFVPPIPPPQVHSTVAPLVPASGNTLVPSYFVLLVEILHRYRAEGIITASRSKVAVELMAKNKMIYQQAGVAKFGEYAALAQSTGLVELGTSEGGEPWMSLVATRSLAPSRPLPSTEPPSMAECSSIMLGPSTAKGHPPTSQPSKPQTFPDPKQLLPVASHFWPLIDIMEDHMIKGVPRPLRSLVSLQLQSHNVYKKAGVAKFRDYIALAESACIVSLGGTGGKGWVCFSSDWRDNYA